MNMRTARCAGCSMVVVALAVAAIPCQAQHGRGGGAETAVAVVPPGWENSRALARKLVGTWSLVSATGEDGGGTALPFGASPKGYMTISSKRRFSIQIFRSGAGDPAADDCFGGGAAANEGKPRCISFFGTYELDEKQRLMLLHVNAANAPDAAGTGQLRVVALSGDELTLAGSPAGSAASGKTVWKRIK